MGNQGAAKTVTVETAAQPTFMWVHAFDHKSYVIYKHFCHVSLIKGLPNLACDCSQFVQVPLGTLVKEQGKTIMDLSEHGQEYLAVFGGAGGKGNRFFLSNENRSPMTATSGMPGEERVLQLELRTMAHAGLVRKSCLSFKLTLLFWVSTPQM